VWDIRLNDKQFHTLLRENFEQIDGFWFTDKQVLKYKGWKKRGLTVISDIEER
jgi:hypothetical protein